MSRSLIGLLPALVLAAACSSESSQAPAVTVRDSAGIRIVENAVPNGVLPVYGELGQADFEVGVLDGDPVYSFSSVVDVRTLPDGDIIVVEGGGLGAAQELRVFDSGGRHVRTIGRRGEGPAEFGGLAPLADLAGDTIWAWDSRLSRLSWFSIDGNLLGDRRVEVGSLVAELTRLSDGTSLADLALIPTGGDGSYAPPARLQKLSAEGDVLDSLRHVGEIDILAIRNTAPNGRPITLLAQPPFGRFIAYTTSTDRLYTGWNGEYRIIVRSLAGDPVIVLAVSGLERPVDPAEVEAVRGRRLTGCPGEDCERTVTAMLDPEQLPERRPAFSDLEVDARGNLWVAEYDPGGNPAIGWQASAWHVFSPGGELLGRVATPPGLVVHEIGADYLLGVQRNELEVPFVRRFPLTRLVG